MNILRRTQDYDPIFLTDEAMLIDKFAVANGVSNFSSVSRAQYRNRFREELSKRASTVCFHVFEKIMTICSRIVYLFLESAISTLARTCRKCGQLTNAIKLLQNRLGKKLQLVLKASSVVFFKLGQKRKKGSA